MLLRIENVSKDFKGFYALKDVSFEVCAGEIHALVGENGAGKSTLIKLLTGVYHMTEGRFVWDGQPVSIRSAADARALGICVIHQDRTLVPYFDCVENAYLGMDYPTRFGMADYRRMRERVRETVERLGMDELSDLTKTADELSPPQRTCLEIVRAMMNDCRLLILDEPTAALTERETARLFTILEDLKRRGTAILYVSHRMDEIFRLTDRITVLRNGSYIATVPTGETTREQLVRLMTDGTVSSVQHGGHAHGEALLQAERLCSADGRVKDCTLTAHAGEILGLFGLGGSGRTELLETIYGTRRRASGTVRVCGAIIDRPSPETAIARGMALIPEDRRGHALIGALSVRENMLLGSEDRYARAGFTSFQAERRAVEEETERLQIRMASREQRVLELSGGNQQKVVFARALLNRPSVLLCDEPTQAVDIATRAQIHRLLRELADNGAAVVVVSSDLKELLELADTIQVISEGHTGDCMPNDGLTAPEVLSRCYADGQSAGSGKC